MPRILSKLLFCTMKTASTTMISLAIKSVSALFEYLNRCALMMVPFLTFQTADGLTFFKWCLKLIFLTPRPPIARAPHATECPCTRKKFLHKENASAPGKLNQFAANHFAWKPSTHFVWDDLKRTRICYCGGVFSEPWIDNFDQSF